MKGKLLLWASLISLLTINIATIAMVKAPIATKIYVDPPKTTAPPGEYLTVDINIADVTGLNAWEVRLWWDSYILYTDKTMITEGPFLKSAGPTSFTSSVFVQTALMSSVGLTPEVIASGSGTLATVKFLVKSEGECPLHLSETSLYDVGLASIPHGLEDGYFSNTVIGNLVRRSAWSEHHHFSISKDEDGVQTLYGKVKNLGEGYGFLRVNFTIWRMDGVPTSIIGKYLVADTETRIAPGDIVDISVGLWESREAAWTKGVYDVQAQCLYSATGDTWKEGEKVKSFSFTIVG